MPLYLALFGVYYKLTSDSKTDDGKLILRGICYVLIILNLLMLFTYLIGFNHRNLSLTISIPALSIYKYYIKIIRFLLHQRCNQGSDC